MVSQTDRSHRVGRINCSKEKARTRSKSEQEKEKERHGDCYQAAYDYASHQVQAQMPQDGKSQGLLAHGRGTSLSFCILLENGPNTIGICTKSREL